MKIYSEELLFFYNHCLCFKNKLTMFSYKQDKGRKSMCVCVCVCEREKEGEGELYHLTLKTPP